ncbi:MAG: DUF2865 domain-containing protein [Hyphomicrobiaceae bacterium]|nr:DUF2865 domain-containing protein [Hyphomicrobiaceae bacterium]
MTLRPTSRLRPRSALLAMLCLAAGVAVSDGAHAQGWNWWPFGQPQEKAPPLPREPVYRDQRGVPYPGQLPPPGAGQPLPAPGQPGVPQAGRDVRGASSICLQLEQRLVAEGQFGNQGQAVLPRIESDMRQIERQMNTAAMQLDRYECWDTFLFSKTLRQTPRCRQLNTDVETNRQRLADLEAQRRQILGRDNRSYQDDIIRELARNNCGPQYQQEARRREASRSPFSDGDEMDGPRGSGNQFGNLPFATYRTICVRLCDGYYFPVSFSTLPNHFQRDAEACQSQCAAPAELFYHQNPGGAVDQAVSVASQQPYTSLKTAWRYRKEFVQGCSCKEAEFQPQSPGERKAETTPAAPQSRPSTARAAPPQLPRQ